MRKDKLLKSLSESLYDYTNDLDNFLQNLEVYEDDKIVKAIMDETDKIHARSLNLHEYIEEHYGILKER